MSKKLFKHSCLFVVMAYGIMGLTSDPGYGSAPAAGCERKNDSCSEREKECVCSGEKYECQGGILNPICLNNKGNAMCSSFLAGKTSTSASDMCQGAWLRQRPNGDYKQICGQSIRNMRMDNQCVDSKLKSGKKPQK